MDFATFSLFPLGQQATRVLALLKKKINNIKQKNSCNIKNYDVDPEDYAFYVFHQCQIDHNSECFLVKVSHK